MLAPHYKQTSARIKDCQSKYILAIQDEMRLNYTSHKAKIDLGVIGKTSKTNQYGIIQHSVLCVTDSNEPLGLMDVNFFDFSEFDTTTNRDHRSIKEKARCQWIDGLNKMRSRLGECDKPIITVADREGDFYEWLHPLIIQEEAFVIRAQHDRCTGDKFKKENKKLSELLSEAPIEGRMEVTIQDVASREMKTIILQLKALKITLPVPKHFTKKTIEANHYCPIQLNVVMAYNEEYEWLLFTSLPIETLAQIQEIVTIYRARWHIEDYHKVLKTGYQVDEIYLHNSRETILNLLSLASISACRLYWLIYVGRSEASIRADKLFEDFEWKSVYVYFNEKIPEECPSLSVVILKIAQLGGYKPIKDANPPGIKTLWIGFQQFTIAAQMYRNMSMKT